MGVSGFRVKSYICKIKNYSPLRGTEVNYDDYFKDLCHNSIDLCHFNH